MSREFDPFEAKMRREGLPRVAIESFRNHYQGLIAGDRGLISEGEIEAVDKLPEASELAGYEAAGRDALARSAVIKLNGGLGTSMGMSRAKSLLPVRGELSFLDIIVRQVLYLRLEHDASIPLLLMNSYRTRDDSLAKLESYPELALESLPLDFLQNKVPRIFADSLAPAICEPDPAAEWCPPGHGDLYPALASSGALRALRERGVEYAFVSNADNLGAVLDSEVLGWFARSGAPFAMEVCVRTQADRKGGHLARGRDGGLLLREVAQCPQDEIADFQNISLHRYFNTNNIWIHLPSLEQELERHGGFLPLPMIRNEKRIDPRDPESPRVLQLESAMGAAIALFPGATALCVPRSRFAPVKTTSDLLVVASDAYVLREDGRLLPAGDSLPRVDLDPAVYGSISEMQARFPHGPPSLIGCSELVVRGDVHFGRGVVCSGRVSLESEGPLHIPDGERLEGA